MSEHEPTSVTVLLDEGTTLTLAEVCRSCGVPAETIIAMVEEGLIATVQESPWRFPAPELRRIQTALRLQRDLELNLAGAALALKLLEELRATRARVERLERLLGE